MFCGKKILVTGAAGFLGSQISKRLSENGNYVFGIDDCTTGKLENIADLGKPFHYQAMDFRDFDVAALSPDIIIHCAAKVQATSYDFANETMSINSLGTKELLDKSRHSDIEKFVYFSSSSVYGNAANIPTKEDEPLRPLNPYAKSKSEGEMWVTESAQDYGINYAIIRPTNIFGENQREDALYGGIIPKFCRQLINDEPLSIYGNGKQTRDYTHVNDFVDGVIMLLDKNNDGAYNIGSGIETSVIDVAELLEGIAGKEIALNYQQPRKIDQVERRCLDISKIKRIGYNPKVSLKDGIRSVYECLEKKTTNNQLAAPLELAQINQTCCSY